MVKTADSRQRQRLTPPGGAQFNQTVCRRFLLQSDVGPVLMVVSQVIAPEASQVLFIQRNDMVQYLAAANCRPSAQPLRFATDCARCANGLETTGLEKPEYFTAELRVTVENDVPVATGKRQSLPELLDDPIAGRVRRDIEMQNPPPIMLDYKKAIKHAKRYGWNREEVESGDRFAVIVEEGQPTFRFALVTTTL
jgi:hypothetical protein